MNSGAGEQTAGQRADQDGDEGSALDQTVAADQFILNDTLTALNGVRIQTPNSLLGDTIAFRARTVGLLDWKGRPDRGLVQSDTQGRNQHGQVVFSMRGQLLVERRQPKT